MFANIAPRVKYIQDADSCGSALLAAQIFSFGLSCTHRRAQWLVSLFTVRRPANNARFPFTPKVARHLLCVRAHARETLRVPVSF